MGQPSGKVELEGGSSSKTWSKRPSVQLDVSGKGSTVSVGAQDYKHPNGRLDSATPTRLDSQDNLIDIHSNDSVPQLFLVKHNFTAEGEGQLTVHQGEKIKVLDYSGKGDWVEGSNSQGEVGWLPTSYTVCCESLEEYSWYHGNITRAAAEVALSSGINGSFLIRESESKPGQYFLSLRYSGRMYHYRIRQNGIKKKYFVMQDVQFKTIKELVHHHSQRADGLVCTLHYPAPNPRKPTIIGLLQADEWEIDRSDIETGKKVGGQYSEVYRGTYLKTGQAVAVKMFREETTDANELLKEAAVMKKVCHAHLVQLLGVCTQELPFFIVTEYLPKGNLLDYIQSPEGRNLDAVTLVYMAQQIASAMAYLEEKGFIHRDLAARNCLVGNEYLVKVGNFGLSQFVGNDVYSVPEGTKIPIRWTAPEAVFNLKHSIKSDIWAFGILLWELATQGMHPYPGVKNDQVLIMLEKGYRLECPEGCPSKIYDMMKRCWEQNPSKRPQFAELHKELKAMSKVNEELERPPTWLPDYEEAVEKQGAVEVAINRCIFMGPPGAGKSCLKHLLVHNKPKEVKISTPVMDKPDVVTISAEEYAVEGTSVWLPVTDEKMAISIRSSCQNREYSVMATAMIPEECPEDPCSDLNFQKRKAIYLQTSLI